MDHSARIKTKAKELGFDLVGIAPAYPVPDFDFFRWWLDQGYAGTMDYLKRGMEKRGDPGKILPEVKSIICCGINYFTENPGVPISRYAQGEDYHRLIGARLVDLEKFIQAIEPTASTKSYVDTGAILERSYAARAGLGWVGKNSCLLNNGYGSYLFLGEILTSLSLETDQPVLDQCGSCTRCLEACPTGALPEPYVLDATRCISYLTIEKKGEFSAEEALLIGDHLYGCDLCQEVCPYNERIQTTSEPGFYPRPGPVAPTIQKLEKISEEDFRKMTEGSAMSRVKFKQWRRNLTAVKKNTQPGPKGR